MSFQSGDYSYRKEFTEFQIGGDVKDNSKIIFLISQ